MTHRLAGEVVSAAIRALIQPQYLSCLRLSPGDCVFRALLQSVAILAEAHADPHPVLREDREDVRLYIAPAPTAGAPRAVVLGSATVNAATIARKVPPYSAVNTLVGIVAEAGGRCHGWRDGARVALARRDVGKTGAGA